jgi:CheY-like chemotaxis protein
VRRLSMGDGKHRILAVDDDESHLRAVREILELEGYEVVTRSQSLGTSKMVLDLAPDLILLDVNMPALSGEHLLSILKRNELTAGIPVVFYSGNDDMTLRHLVQKSGATGYIRKGDPAALRRKVAVYLGIQPQRPT